MNLKQLLKEADALRNPIIDRIKKDWAVERNSSNNTRFNLLVEVEEVFKEVLILEGLE